jgi:phosphoribosylformylglycinamidine synthase II
MEGTIRLSMQIHKFIVHSKTQDPRSAHYMKEAQALGLRGYRQIAAQDLYFIEGQLSQEDCKQLALKLLTDPVTQMSSWMEIPAARTDPEPGSIAVEIALRPGVTDPVAEQIVRAAHELGFKNVQRAATGQRFIIEGTDQASAEKLARRLLVNDVIQHWAVGEIAPSFPQETESSGAVEIIPIRKLKDDALLALSKDRRAALDLAEMKAIQGYFKKEKRDPTDVEFETIAQTWSEHCGHKTFKARVTIDDGRQTASSDGPSSVVDSLIKTYLKSATDKINAPWVISAFVDNAGIIDFDDEFEVSFKAETHNHPSAIEPFGGANTGVGGVIRDVLGVSAKPIANTDILCFGPQDMDPNSLPEGVLHPRRIQSGVVAGVQDYGNKIGIPTVNGAILYDEGYTSNPLVFCGCVGIAPKGKHVRTPRVDDRVIVLGGRTGRDGLRGATVSSMTMDAQTGEVAGASVQIGDPVTEKGLIDVIVRARDLGLYNAITDCGAGGLSSAAGEMASSIGADIELSCVRLKYAGLAPWEIWLSEAQERMVLAVSPENIAALQELCDTFDTELTDIGSFTGSGRLIVRYQSKKVLDMENEFLHEGIPQRQLKAVIREQSAENSKAVNRPQSPLAGSSMVDIKDTLLKLLSSPNIASKSTVIRIKPIGTRGLKGIVLSNGINPEYGKRDAYKMAWSVIDEAIRNAVAVGADPDRIAILDNFCWGDPLRPETMGSLVEACRGCHDAALFYGTPFISGKDSLNNEYLGSDGQRHAIPPTLLISAIGIIDDVTTATTMDLKSPGNLVYLVGEFKPEYSNVPDVAETTPPVYRALHKSITHGLIKSAHDLSEGGFAVTAAEMCIGGRLGLNIPASIDPFAEVNGCLLVEISPADQSTFETEFAGLPFTKIGEVTDKPVLKISDVEVPVEELVKAFNS